MNDLYNSLSQPLRFLASSSQGDEVSLHGISQVITHHAANNVLSGTFLLLNLQLQLTNHCLFPGGNQKSSRLITYIAQVSEASCIQSMEYF